MTLAQCFTITKKPTIFVLFSWNLVKMNSPWIGYIAKISAQSDKNCGFFNNSIFLGQCKFFLLSLYIPWRYISSIWCRIANICHKSLDIISCVSNSTFPAIRLNNFINSNGFFRITGFSMGKFGIFFINNISKFISMSIKLFERVEIEILNIRNNS